MEAVVHGRHAVIIGVDRCNPDVDLPNLQFAAADARAIRAVLTDPENGTFDRKDAQLFVDDEGDVHWPTVQTALHTLAVGSDESDILVIYFAGHLLSANWNGVSDDYLVTPDLTLSTLRERPHEGLRMAFLRNDVFDKFRGRSFLILDCCRAGSLVGAGSGDVALVRVGGRPPRQHSVLMAAPEDGIARERVDLRHGVMTKHLLDALRGKAIDQEGRVTFGRMAECVVEQSMDPKPGLVMQQWGASTVLTRHGSTASGVGVSVSDPMPPDVRVEELANPLDGSALAITELLGRIFARSPRLPRPAPSSTIEAFGPSGEAGLVANQNKTEFMRAAMEADAAALLECTSSGLRTISTTERFRDGDVRRMMERTNRALFPSERVWFGDVVHASETNRLLCVPLRHGIESSLVLVVVNPAEKLLEIGQPMAKILETIWRLSLNGRNDEAQIAVLTALRSAFGRLPSRLYERCFQLYREVLDSFSMVFQPVVTIDKRPRQVDVYGYEALARQNPNDPRAPKNLLDVAHIWGDRFVVERDEVILRKAIDAYDRAHAKCYGDGGGAPRPVSINVAVRSLLSDSYLAVVKEAIELADLNPSAVTLEISEHDNIEERPDEDWNGKSPLAYFHERLMKIADAIDVRFAVDDFGVGYSSLSRMAELPLTQIKVDRPVLHHPLGAEELRLVAQIARHAQKAGYAASSRVVIVEGVDSDSPITLQQIHVAGIQHVQGFITGEWPSPTIRREMALEIRERIASEVRGDNGHGVDKDARGDRAGSSDPVRRGA